MPHPPPWPQPHPHAENFDLFWLVRQLPPDPFPDDQYDYGSDLRFGPPGTHWVFTWESLVNRQTAVGVSQGAKAAIERLIRKAAIKLPPAGSTGWVTPYALAPPATPVPQELLVPMNWIRTAINGNVGTTEQVVHILNWRNKTTENAPVTNADLKTFGDLVRDRWAAFILSQRSGGAQLAQYWSQELRYTDVRTALLVQDAPATKPHWPLTTQYSAFGANVGGTGGPTSLPYEVAFGVSFNTNWRGTSRFRGRLYLGPLTTNLLAPAGMLDAAVTNEMGLNLGNLVLKNVSDNSPNELHIISQKYNTSSKVEGIRVGHVPDSQRRRRRGQIEGYVQAWGNPVGSHA